jgi:hypothetical protein
VSCCALRWRDFLRDKESIVSGFRESCISGSTARTAAAKRAWQYYLANFNTAGFTR